MASAFSIAHVEDHPHVDCACDLNEQHIQLAKPRPSYTADDSVFMATRSSVAIALRRRY